MASRIGRNSVPSGWTSFRRWSPPHVRLLSSSIFVTVESSLPFSEHQRRRNPLETRISSISGAGAAVGLLLHEVFRFIGEEWRKTDQMSRLEELSLSSPVESFSPSKVSSCVHFSCSLVIVVDSFCLRSVNIRQRLFCCVWFLLLFSPFRQRLFWVFILISNRSVALFNHRKVQKQ